MAPLLLVRTVAERQVIVARCDDAARRGIRTGMTLTQARALCADVVHAEHDPIADRRALEALGRWLMRFTPIVALDVSDCPHAIFLDITGCERLFGSAQHIVQQTADALSCLRISAHLAAAPTPGAAYALAFAAGQSHVGQGCGERPLLAAVPKGRALAFAARPIFGTAAKTAHHTIVPAFAGSHGAVVSTEDLPAALAPLPPLALRIGDDLAAALHHLGLTTIGQVIDLPRRLLPARFGPELLLRIDQALGVIPEPLVPLQHLMPVAAKVEFDGMASSLEAVWTVFQNLIGQIIVQLAARGCGARRLDVELLRFHEPPLCKSILLSRPSRDGVNLFNLFRCAIEEKIHFTGRGGEDGFRGMALRVPIFEKCPDEQIGLLGHENYAGQLELDRLVERLRIRLGEASVVRPQPVESYIPEKAWESSEDHPARRAAGVGQNRLAFPPLPIPRERAGVRVFGRTESRSRIKSRPHPNPLPEYRERGSDISTGHLPRPLHLFPKPIAIRVMVCPSDDAEGHPAAFVHEGEVRTIVHAVGPERIAGRWWDGHDKTRDYFDVEETNSRRFWLFRVRQTNRWYLHGTFE